MKRYDKMSNEDVKQLNKEFHAIGIKRGWDLADIINHFGSFIVAELYKAGLTQEEFDLVAEHMKVQFRVVTEKLGKLDK